MDLKKVAFTGALILGAIFVHFGLRAPGRHAIPGNVEHVQLSGHPMPADVAPPTGTYKERDQIAAVAESEIAKVSAKEPQGFARRLNLYLKYSKKVLKSEGEVRLLHALLADDATQTAALANLNPATEEDRRMQIVDYLLAGLEDQKNIGHSALREKVISFLQSDVPHGLDKPMIKSLAADRIELFVALRHTDPTAADQLSAAPKSDLNKRIYQYALINYGKRGG